MESTTTASKTGNGESNQPSSSTADLQSKTAKYKKGKTFYARFRTKDGSLIDGLVTEPGKAGPDGVVPPTDDHPAGLAGWRVNNCYSLRDVGVTGRLWALSVATKNSQWPENLPIFSQVEETLDDPDIPLAPLLWVDRVKKWYPLKRGFFETVLSREEMSVKAVDLVSLTVPKGEIFALAGESGSGKTTLGKLLLRLVQTTSGSIFFEGRDITRLGEREMKPLRKRMQIVFQDPFESLDPRMIIKEIVAEPIRVQRIAKGEDEVEERVKNVLTDVELVPPEEFLYRFPHELSGGQRQRVAVARAFVLNPSLVIADEPVSMLDVSIRAEIVNLMVDLVKKSSASIIFISHDLALAKHIADRIGVMYLGKMMELSSSANVVDQPLHPYTQALISAVPVPDPESKRTKEVISGEIPSPVDPPPGCRFHTRCPYAHERCTIEEPPLAEVEKGHFVACHLYT